MLLFDESFRGILGILQGILDTPFSGVRDGILRHTIETGIQEWAGDVVGSRHPTGVFLEDLPMDSPAACAVLPSEGRSYPSWNTNCKGWSARDHQYAVYNVAFHKVHPYYRQDPPHLCERCYRDAGTIASLYDLHV